MTRVLNTSPNQPVSRIARLRVNRTATVFHWLRRNGDPKGMTVAEIAYGVSQSENIEITPQEVNVILIVLSTGKRSEVKHRKRKGFTSSGVRRTLKHYYFNSNCRNVRVRATDATTTVRYDRIDNARFRFNV